MTSTGSGWARRWRLGASCLAVTIASAAPGLAQDAAPEVEELRERVRALEEKVRSLEAPAAPATEPDGPVTPAGEPEPGTPGASETQGGGPAGSVPRDRVGDDYPGVGAPGPAEAGEVEGPEGLQVELPLSLKLKIGGKLRLRGEYRDPADYRLPGTFGRPASDDRDEGTDFVEMRTRLAFDFQVLEPLRALIELQDSRLWGDTPIGADAAELHLRQGFLELQLQQVAEVPLLVRAGRFEIMPLGDQRLISTLDWSNVSRMWDGAQVVFEPEGWFFTAFATNIREGRVFAPEGDENDDFWFLGAYGSCRLVPDHELDAYLFWRHLSDDVAFTSERGRAGDRKDFTLGARLKGKLALFDYSGEAAYQWGDQAGDRVQAWAAATTAGINFGLGDTKVRIGAEYAFASGDPEPADGTIETFDPLLPFGHFFHGHMDLIGWRNLHTVSGYLKVAPLKELSFHLDGHVFWLDKREDAWYDAAKNPVRRDLTGRARSRIGTELDVYVKYVLWERVAFWGGYSHFFPDQYVRDTGEHEDQDWVFLLAEASF